MQQQNNDKKSGLSWSTPAQSSSASSSSSKQSTLPSTAKSLPPAKNSGNGGGAIARYVGIFVGGLVVGILLAWGWSAAMNRGTSTATTASSTVATTNVPKNNQSQTAASANATSVASNVTVGESGTVQNSPITVPSPQKAGGSVVIDNATVNTPTWIVVYENNSGKPGNVLGAQLFFTSGPGIVTLLRPTVAGDTYFVGKAVDNGDRKYEKASDKAAVNDDGSLQLVSFSAN